MYQPQINIHKQNFFLRSAETFKLPNQAMPVNREVNSSIVNSFNNLKNAEYHNTFL